MQPHHTRQLRRSQAIIAGAASVALLATTPAAPAQGSSAPVGLTATTAALAAPPSHEDKEPRVPRNVRLVRSRVSILGNHEWYRQTKDGIVVAGAWWGRHIDKDNNVTVWDGRRNVSKLNRTEPKISVDDATRSVASLAQTSRGAVSNASITKASVMVLPPLKTTSGPRLVWAVDSEGGEGARTSYVDAVTGKVLLTRLSDKKASQDSDDKFSVQGNGKVFNPNPVVKLQDQSLTDQKDSKEAVPPAGYSMRPLRRLDYSHSLRGRWVRIMKDDRATSGNNTYLYTRDDPRFEQVVAYEAVDTVQGFLQRLGFIDVNAESQKMFINTIPDDNSYYNPSSDTITMGRGGVDDAEDPEVVWHEYGHAVQDDQVLDWGWSRQGRAMGEGFGDYLAVTMSQPTAADTAITPAACVMDWDAVSYTSRAPHCLRRTDGNKHFPEDLVGQEHDDGEIWSRALWDINQTLGRNMATRIIVEAHFWMNPRSRMPNAAHKTVRIAQRLHQDPAITQAVRQAFLDRRIL